MLTIRKMHKRDVPILYAIALRAFQPDFEKYGVYPPLLRRKQKKFLPPLLFGNVILTNETIVGALFLIHFFKKGTIGNIFIDPVYQKKGIGRQALLEIEKRYPIVDKWTLETPSKNYNLHTFYESLGYIKTGQQFDKKSGIEVYRYEKNSTCKKE